MDYLTAEKAMRDGKLVIVQDGSQVLMGKLVGQSGHFFTLETASGRRAPDLIAEKISATNRNY